MKRHQELLTAAVERDGEGQRRLMDGDLSAAQNAFISAADLYRRSWQDAPPRSYGRLVGMLKAAVLSGEDPSPAAEFAHAALAQDPDADGSPTAAYALALADLIAGDDRAAAARAEAMRGGSDAFDRTASAIGALAEHDGKGYGEAVREIVHDFEQRSVHLTGVAIADTALVLQRLAAARGLAPELRSEVLPV